MSTEEIDLMRASKRDIVEYFGYAPDDVTTPALQNYQNKSCPFLCGLCSKIIDNKIYATCSLKNGVSGTPEEDVIVCPNRMYANRYQILQDVVDTVWPGQDCSLIVGGSLEDLAQRAKQQPNPVVALGQKSGKEISLTGETKMSMDWVLQRYQPTSQHQIQSTHFVGVEVQSIDTTGNYKDNLTAYEAIKEGQEVDLIPDGGYGFNWANVHKRILPQLIRKGNIYKNSCRCDGFFFIVPDIVYQKFEIILGPLSESPGPNKDTLSILTYRLGSPVPHGQTRSLERVRTIHLDLNKVALAFISYVHLESVENFNQQLQNIIT